MGINQGVGTSPTQPQWRKPLGGRYLYKGQLHCHGKVKIGGVLGIIGEAISDIASGNPPLASELQNRYAPKQWTSDVIKAYRDKGYHFICVTNHNHVTPVEDKFGIKPVLSVEDGQNYGHHMIVIGVNKQAARRPEATRYDENHDGLCGWKTGNCGNITGRLTYYSSIQRAVVVMAHPKKQHGTMPGDQGFSFEELLNHAGRYTGMDVYCPSSDPNAARADDWWDALLKKGKHAWGYGGDDCHNVNSPPDFNRSWVIVRSDASPPMLRPEHLIGALKTGNFYTVVREPVGPVSGLGPTDLGPSLTISVSGPNFTVQTDRPSTIEIWSSTTPFPSPKKTTGSTSLTYTMQPRDQYVRAVVTQQRDDALYVAFSQPVFSTTVPIEPSGESRTVITRDHRRESRPAVTRDHRTGPVVVPTRPGKPSD